MVSSVQKYTPVLTYEQNPIGRFQCMELCMELHLIKKAPGIWRYIKHKKKQDSWRLDKDKLSGQSMSTLLAVQTK